jgi:hypothetical protein
MIGEGDCGATGGMKIGRGNRNTRRKPAPVPLCPPQIPLDQELCIIPWRRMGSGCVDPCTLDSSVSLRPGMIWIGDKFGLVLLTQSLNIHMHIVSGHQFGISVVEIRVWVFWWWPYRGPLSSRHRAPLGCRWRRSPGIGGKGNLSLVYLSSMPWRHMGERMYRSTFSWPRH